MTKARHTYSLLLAMWFSLTPPVLLLLMDDAEFGELFMRFIRDDAETDVPLEDDRFDDLYSLLLFEL